MSEEKDFAYHLSDWQKYQTREEVDFIRKCAVSVESRFLGSSVDPIFVNIGAGAGTSTIAVLEACKMGVMFSIDILATGSEFSTNEHLRLDEAGLADTGRVIRIWGDSKIVGIRWPMKVHFLFIDGGHEKEEVYGDINIWVKRVRPDGVFMIHDYNSRHWPEVKNAVDELIIPDSKYEFLGLVDTLIAFRVKSQ